MQRMSALATRPVVCLAAAGASPCSKGSTHSTKATCVRTHSDQMAHQLPIGTGGDALVASAATRSSIN